MEQQTEKLLPYQKLLKENNIQESDLDRGTQQMISDLKKTLNMLYAQSQRKGINVQISENTQNKINTYDRHICNDILDYLDELEEQKEAEKQEAQKEEAQKEEAQKEENSSSESHSQTTNSQISTHTNKETNDSNENSLKIGFWNWE